MVLPIVLPLIISNAKVMITAKTVILTAINFKGIDQVRVEAKELADKLLCSEQYVKTIINQVSKKRIIIK